MSKPFLHLLCLCVFVAPWAASLTGSGDSAAGVLETVRPEVVSAAALTEKSVSVTFSEPMGLPGAAAEGNYIVSLSGRGTLSDNPSTVAGSGPFVLLWDAGEMRNGVPLAVGVSGLQDSAGNPVHSGAASVVFQGMGVDPQVTEIAVTPSRVAAGGVVRISFQVSEALQGDPVVTVNGNEAVLVEGGKAAEYVYSYMVSPADSAGLAAVEVAVVDLAGNAGVGVASSLLEIMSRPEGMPLRAWPAAVLVVAVGAFLARRARRGGGFAAAALMAALASATAFAAEPVVSSVAFVQENDGAGGTRVAVTYDLFSSAPCGVTVWLSKDGGMDGFPYPATSVSGDISGVVSGSGRRVFWNIAADYPDEHMPQARIRVVADDNAPVTYTFSYLAGPNGSLSGSTPQTVPQGGDGAWVTALAATGHHFVNWSDGSTQNPRRDLNASANITVTANFAVNIYTLNYLSGPNGSVSGITPQSVAHGGSGTEVTAVPAPGYRFLRWNDNSTQNPRTDSNVTMNRSVTAQFIQTHTLSYAAGANGSISGPTPQTVDHGGSGAAVNAVPGTGHHFVDWSDLSVQNPRTDTNVTADLSVTARFEPNVYTLSYTAPANGSITGPASQNVAHGENGAEVTAVPAQHYTFIQWSDGSTQNPRTDLNVTGNIAVTAEFAVTFDIEKVVDVASNSWVSSLWGHTGPKVAFDGTAYYTVSLSGPYGTATGAVHKYQGGVWTKGYEWTLNYQPPMIMVDATGRLVIVYAKSSGAPGILRSAAPGDISSFNTISAAPVTWAGYMGAGMYGNKLVLGYINHPDTYSFWVAAVDVSTGVWTTPKMLAQHVPLAPEPQVSWLYPTIVPRADGFHMVVINNADANNLYNELKYMKLDYSLNYLVSPETVDIVPPPYTVNYVSHDSMLVGSDNAVYVMGRNINGGVNDTLVHRRDGGSGAWTHTSLAPLGFSASYTALFESPAAPGTLWLTRRGVDQMFLYRSTDAGSTWQSYAADSFAPHGLTANFMHGILQGSGGTLPTRPTVVFTASPAQPYSLWFLQWQTN